MLENLVNGQDVFRIQSEDQENLNLEFQNVR